MFVVLCLQVPGDQLSDAGTRGGAKGHHVSPYPVDSDLGNAVLAAAQYRPQIEEGDSAEEFNVDDFTAPLVWISDTDSTKWVVRGECFTTVRCQNEVQGHQQISREVLWVLDSVPFIITELSLPYICEQNISEYIFLLSMLLLQQYFVRISSHLNDCTPPSFIIYFRNILSVFFCTW